MLGYVNELFHINVHRPNLCQSQGICMQLTYVTDLRVLPILVSVSCTMINSNEISRKWLGCSLSSNLVSRNVL